MLIPGEAILSLKKQESRGMPDFDITLKWDILLRACLDCGKKSYSYVFPVKIN
jgi:hypothetical protein